MSNTDSYVRAVIAAAIMLYAFITSSFFLGTVAVILFFTAYTKFCFIYYLFDFNTKLSEENYYLSLLPKYNTAPVFIFDNKTKELLFRNSYASSMFPDVESLSHLSLNEDNIAFCSSGRCYQVDFQYPEKENVILCYMTDITKVLELNDEVEEIQKEVIYAMGEIGETRSKETGNHVKRVALYSKELALLYGLSYKEAEILQMASPMHDIGKVGIADEILNAPRKLTPPEFEIMKTHAQLGYDMLKHSKQPILQAAAIVAHQHHEKWDGSGYPQGLQGEDIHIYGRITAVADVFDALGSDRVYKKAWELEKILHLFKEQRAKHFDPTLIDLFFNNLEKFLEIRDRFKDIG